MGNDTPLIDHQHIAKHTVKDSLLCKVKLLVKEGWKENDCKIDSIEPYFNRKDEISIDKECLLRRSRVIVPEKLRKDILKLLDITHSGIVNMKSMVGNYVWWPKIDIDIEATVKNCQPCQVNQKKPQASIPHPWVKPNEPWERIHIHRLLRLIWTYVAHNCLFILQVGRSDKDEKYDLKEDYRGITKII